MADISVFRRNSLLPRPQREGFALVVVLVAIVMLSLLVVGLIIMAENDFKATARVADSLDARLAADSVVEIVESQIVRAATEGIDALGRGTATWASQPGAVRSFDSDGNLINIHKLYSSAEMESTDAAGLAAGGDLSSAWATEPDSYVDLNEPVKRGGQWIYPIVSPEALSGPDAVVGFSVEGGSGSGGKSWDDSLAMPVRWLYVMEDGGLRANLAAGDQPVLRVAFWTDDEASKINLNTASATDGSSYSDVPRSAYTEERDEIALKQPSQNEFNRYPGHPATVSLTTVFSGSSPALEEIQNLILASPRYEWGGSENATLSMADGQAGTGVRRAVLGTSKSDRLYATLDEYWYRTEPDGDGTRQSQIVANVPALDTRRFFLTTSSRSADLNLFGQPRVTIWPISAIDDANHRTPFDQLIVHCATLGGAGESPLGYYYLRRDAMSQTEDWSGAGMDRNQKVYAYLRDLTSREIPGFGGNFEKKYDRDSGGVAGERDQILTEIFDYIRCVNLNETYRDQPAGFVPFTTKALKTDGSDPTIGKAAEHDQFHGMGFVLPVKIPAGGGRPRDTRGAGRVPGISEVGLWLIQTKGGNEPATPPATGGQYNPDLIPDPPEVQPGLLVETFSAMQGFMPWIASDFSIAVTNVAGGPNIRDKDGNAIRLFPDAFIPPFHSSPAAGVGVGQFVGGVDGWTWTLGKNANAFETNPFLRKKATFNAPNTPGNKGTIRDREAIPIGTSIAIDAGEFDISLRSNGQTYQTFSIDLPSTTLPVPIPRAPKDIASNASKNGWGSRSGPSDASGNDNARMKFFVEDVVRGIPFYDGDFRTAAYLERVPAQFFDYSDFISGGDFRLHGFRGGINSAYLGTENGTYVEVPFPAEVPQPDLTTETEAYRTSYRPKIRRGISSLRAMGWEGDFDNGLSQYVDGPYLNKSDEGGYSSGSSAPYFVYQWAIGLGLFSPLRQMPSAVVFGSLPTSVLRNEAAYLSGNRSLARPWRTLNFCPNPLAKASHFGLTNPPDHLLLDLFHMPVVEPYAISEPFSTAGRINMNYQILPFTGIKRRTALHAALAAQKVIAVRNDSGPDYKFYSSAKKFSKTIRYAVDAEETLKQFDRRFDVENDVFRSAAEICGIFLVPKNQGATSLTIKDWWDGYLLTGNNSRERPYATLYPLLTTKSNVFTTHVRAQSVKRKPDGSFAVAAEYRGYITFERYLDSNEPHILSGTVNPDQVSLEPYFRFRTLLSKQFNP